MLRPGSSLNTCVQSTRALYDHLFFRARNHVLDGSFTRCKREGSLPIDSNTVRLFLCVRGREVSRFYLFKCWTSDPTIDYRCGDYTDYRCYEFKSNSIRELCDNFKPQTAFQQWNRIDHGRWSWKLARLCKSPTPESHWWHLFHKEGKRCDSKLWFRIWQYQTAAWKRYAHLRPICDI
jgi:hypothetical protein